jgi:hypothetical protein
MCAQGNNTNNIPQEGNVKIKITIGNKEMTAVMYDNTTVRNFVSMLPLTLDMSELNGNEKYYYLADNLPTATERVGSIKTGDIMLYGSNCLVLFYKNFSTSYSYTKLGYIEDTSGLTSALGNNNVQVTFSVIN